MGLAHASQRIHRRLGLPVGCHIAIVRDVGKALKELLGERRADRRRADRIDADSLGPEVDGETSRNLPDRTFGQAVAEAVGLSDVALVGSIDHDAAAAAEMRHGRAQRVDRPLDVGVDHQIELFVGDVKQRIAAMNAGIGDDRIESAERLNRFAHGRCDLILAADVAVHIEHCLRLHDADCGRNQEESSQTA